MINLTPFGIQRTAANFVRRSKQVRRNLQEATRQASDLVAASARERLRPARRLNVQDSSSPRQMSGRRPVSVRYSGNGLRADVIARPHVTNARTKALQSVFARTGELKKLERRGLWINPQSYILQGGKFRGRRKMQYASRDGLKFFRFSRHPELRRWAQRPDRGYQLMRHSVRLGGAQLRILVMAPSLERNRVAIKSLYRAAALRNLAGG